MNSITIEKLSNKTQLENISEDDLIELEQNAWDFAEMYKEKYEMIRDFRLKR